MVELSEERIIRSHLQKEKAGEAVQPPHPLKLARLFLLQVTADDTLFA